MQFFQCLRRAVLLSVIYLVVMTWVVPAYGYAEAGPKDILLARGNFHCIVAAKNELHRGLRTKALAFARVLKRQRAIVKALRQELLVLRALGRSADARALVISRKLRALAKLIRQIQDCRHHRGIFAWDSGEGSSSSGVNLSHVSQSSSSGALSSESPSNGSSAAQSLSVSITVPPAGTTVSGIVTLSADATSGVQITLLNFFIDPSGAQQLVGGDFKYGAPFINNWDSTLMPNGTHDIVAVARDASGNVVQSAAVSVTVDNPVLPPYTPQFLPIPDPWAPPIGIPMPPFGINEVAGPPNYYVDNSVNCSDSSNGSHGSSNQPRCTIPTTLAAGDVVEVRGGPYYYNTSVSTPTITASGTSAHPIFIRGIGQPIIKSPCTVFQGCSGRDFTVFGSYYVLEGFVFSDGSTLAPAIKGDHGVFRNNEVRNLQLPYGVGLSGGYGSTVDHMVVYHNHIHHNGNYLTTVDEKNHGIKFSNDISYHAPNPPSYIWILDNDMHHNSGQSIQIGDDLISWNHSDWPNHIYIGRNNFHQDRELALGIKQAEDVVISQNRVWGYGEEPPNNDGRAAIPGGMAAQRFGANRIWVIFNEVLDSVSGIRANGNNEDPNFGPADAYIIGNLIHNVHSLHYDPTDIWSSAGTALIGWDDKFFNVLDNTIVDVDKCASYVAAGNYTMSGNLCKQSNVPMTDMYPTPCNTCTNSGAIDYAFYDPQARVAWYGVAPIISLLQFKALGQCARCQEGDAMLDAGFRPRAGSPLLGANVRNPAYDTFAALYGLDIAVDFSGSPRPQSGIWSIGALE